MIKGKSFKGQDTPRLVDTEYQQCNFVSKAPLTEVDGKKVGVRLFPGDDTPRTFIDCNLINRIVPPGSTVTGGNTAIIEFAVVDSIDDVVIDGEKIELMNKVDIIYGNYVDGVAKYKDTPIVIPRREKGK